MIHLSSPPFLFTSPPSLSPFLPPSLPPSLHVAMYSGEGPDPAEEFTVVRVSETKVAFKTGYGRYVSVNAAGELVGRMEAIGPRETWEPVFEEVGGALRSIAESGCGVKCCDNGEKRNECHRNLNSL